MGRGTGKSAGSVLVWFFLGLWAAAVRACPVEDLVTSLPGQPPITARQYAGYVDVDVQLGRSLFYYFVEAERDPNLKPLTLWLNGGPGCSSIGGGGFTGVGPFFPTGDGRGLQINTMSWNKVSNVLFVESPIGVGWSYSNTSNYISDDVSTCKDMLVFMLKWFQKFPSFNNRTFFLAGESYAGHFIPQLADAMLNYNANSKGFKFNVKGLIMGNPLITLRYNAAGTYEFLWSHGMISDELEDKITKVCDFDDYLLTKPHNVSQPCEDAINEASKMVSSHINTYDVILDVCNSTIAENEIKMKRAATKISLGVDVCMPYERKFYFNLPEVQNALHANRTKLPYEWKMCSNVSKYSYFDSKLNTFPLLKKMVQNQIPVWIYSGDQDSMAPLMGSRTLVRELAQELNFNMTVPYGAWYHKGQVGGWVVEYGNLLTFATVRGASHMVPFSNPSTALHLFTTFVNGRRLPDTIPISMIDFLG